MWTLVYNEISIVLRFIESSDFLISDDNSQIIENYIFDS
jgi:hypothetical protein